MDTNTIEEKIKAIQSRMGKETLNDEEILIMAAYELSKTYTREEKNYSA